MSDNMNHEELNAEPQMPVSRREVVLAAGATGVALGALSPSTSVAAASTDSISKHAEYLGMPWEPAYGYAQAVKVGDTIYVSGQLSHDDKGNMVAPAPLYADGHIADHGNMGPQMAQSYSNAIEVLARYGATLDNVVEEVLYVTDMDAAFAVAGKVRAEAYGGTPVVASTILVTPRLAFRDQLIEIKLIAKQ